METSSQEQIFFNPLASKPEAEDPNPRLSSSSSSSSSYSSSSYASSIEAEPRPDNNSVDQSPPTQIMERSSTNNTTSTPTTPPYRFPPHVFERDTSTAEWSTLSNESLFSIHMANNSFTEIDYDTFPLPPSPRAPTLPSPLPSPPQNTNQGGGRVVEEAKTPVNIGMRAAETDIAYHASKDKERKAETDKAYRPSKDKEQKVETEKAYRASKEKEQKAAASIRDVIMASEAANNYNSKTNNLDRSLSRRSEDFSVRSFAFPVFGNADKGGLQGSTPPRKPKISLEADGDEEWKNEEASKPVTPKAEADCGSNRYPRWLCCFPCCTTSSV